MAKEKTEKPKIIVLCGSSRFVDEMAVIMWLLERDHGQIAMGLHLLPQWYSVNLQADHLAEHEGVNEAMDELHLRKIDLADEVLVVNPEGYIGKSTKREVEYATKKEKSISFYSGSNLEEQVKTIAARFLQDTRALLKGEGAL
jgi:hypothetical protein